MNFSIYHNIFTVIVPASGRTKTGLYVNLEWNSTFNKKIKMASGAEFLGDSDREEDEELVNLDGRTCRSRTSATGLRPTSAMGLSSQECGLA